MELHLIDIQGTKTYATEKNAIKAVDKVFPNKIIANEPGLIRYFIARNREGRYFPIFIGEVALQYGLHFHFNIIG